jgi:hypothetical protein
MTEEEAIFTLGKRFSMLRNRGEDMPLDRIEVGNSMVRPEELADEYDRHFPPGPPTPKRDTERRFDYELVYLGEIRMGASISGLLIRHGDNQWDTLKTTDVFFCASQHTLRERIETTKCNRFDVITGWNYTFVVDKVAESLSVVRARYRVDDTTFCDETPIFGAQRQYLETIEKVLGTAYFPFIPFDRFWQVWDEYVALRKQQISELRSTEQAVPSDGHKPSSSVSTAGSTAPADAH